MVVWCTHNWRRDGSSFTWHQPCNNQTVLSAHLYGGYLKKKKKKIAGQYSASVQRCIHSRSHRLPLYLYKKKMMGEGGLAFLVFHDSNFGTFCRSYRGRHKTMDLYTIYRYICPCMKQPRISQSDGQTCSEVCRRTSGHRVFLLPEPLFSAEAAWLSPRVS